MSVKKIHNVHEFEHLNLNDKFVVVNDTTESEFVKGVEYKVTGLTADKGVVTVNTETAKFTYRSERNIKSVNSKPVVNNSSTWISANTIRHGNTSNANVSFDDSEDEDEQE